MYWLFLLANFPPPTTATPILCPTLVQRELTSETYQLCYHGWDFQVGRKYQVGGERSLGIFSPIPLRPYISLAIEVILHNSSIYERDLSSRVYCQKHNFLPFPCSPMGGSSFTLL